MYDSLGQFHGSHLAFIILHIILVLFKFPWIVTRHLRLTWLVGC